MGKDVSFKFIWDYIKKFNRIIIHRHTRPDFDAIGSQFGLKLALKKEFPDKEIYAVGDLNLEMYHAKMDIIPDNYYEDALVIVTDVAVTKLVSDKRYSLAKNVIVIDHHENECDFRIDYQVIRPKYSSASMLVSDILLENNVTLDSEIASFLYLGVVTDTGRFLYLDSLSASSTFKIASYLTSYEPDISLLYDLLYTETLEYRRKKDTFRDFKVRNGVGYRINTPEIVRDSGLDIGSINRGMINLMSGLQEVPIWISFTYDPNDNIVLGEIRSRGIVVVDVARSYGGGGHNYACGFSLKDFSKVDEIIDKLGELVKENVK
ncbi:MAG: bifunctional oligoribonuclease/PAP phosphatase NrnA [Acholeplasmatales bacterium]|jgi:phosphoesterase RecJ-like protein|nr:bifunctional oligoribonuclease/PAP phosphatase NrnA [Acholeplasmatales bacterium]